MERRFTGMNNSHTSVEKREDGKRYIVGYGAVFFREGDAGTEYKLWGDVIERIKPTAFNRAISDKDDARALFNHDPNFLLGRISAGTMKLSTDTVGLRYEIPVDENDADHLKVVRKLERGDLKGSSFSFIPKKVTWEETEELSIRNIDEVELFDVGPVTFPAYESTTAGMRSADSDMAGIKKELEEHRKQSIEPLKLRLRLIENDI